MKFKISSKAEEFDVFIDLNQTVEAGLNKVINDYPNLELNLDPNDWTYQSKSILNQNPESLKKTFKEHRMNQNSIITINDKRGVELALNRTSF
jgi:hypothetical protein